MRTSRSTVAAFPLDPAAPLASSAPCMKTPVLLLTAVALVLAGCVTQSQSGNAALMNLFKKADADGNSQVSRREFTDLLIAEAFANYDKNKDGVVTLAEWTSGGGTRETFLAMGGRSGGLTLAQVQSSQVAQNQMALPFDQADTSKTGYLTLEEFVAYRKAAAPYVR
jgi:Ca2+-binding EF-hand superfamily protein